MPKILRWLAGLLVVGLLITFVISYREIYPPTLPPPPMPRGPDTPVTLANDTAHALSLAMAAYHDKHGRLPTLAEFWQCVGRAPVKNSLTGSDTVVAMSRDVDARAVGWVYDGASGAVHPGGIFGATTMPTPRLGS